jgi:transposase
VEGAIDVTLRRRFLSRRQRKVINVDPKYTSQECPNCHALEKKSLSSVAIVV